MRVAEEEGTDSCKESGKKVLASESIDSTEEHLWETSSNNERLVSASGWLISASSSESEELCSSNQLLQEVFGLEKTIENV